MLLRHSTKVHLQSFGLATLPEPSSISYLRYVVGRHASLTSAIERAVRRSQTHAGPAGRENERYSRDQPSRTKKPHWLGRGRQASKEKAWREAKENHSTRSDTYKSAPVKDANTRSQQRDNRPWKDMTLSPKAWGQSEEAKIPPGTPDLPSSTARNSDSPTPPKEAGKRKQSTVPISIPYTTPASEFLYGRYCVEAALRSDRRKMYKLYIQEKKIDEEGGNDQTISKLALAHNTSIVKVNAKEIPMMDKMSGSRPHNGYVLEASPLPKLRITHMLEVERNGEVKFAVDYQFEEEEAINGRSPQLANQSPKDKYPLVLMLDRILDPGNLGAIIRSAAFLGVSAIVLIDHGTAPLSAVALKASAGSAEHMPLLMTRKSVEFIKQSQRSGWRFYAAASSESVSTHDRRPDPALSSVRNSLLNHPIVLILGEEGVGVQQQHQRLADSVVGIERIGGINFGLESLNVSAAAALLCDRFIRNDERFDSLPLTSNGQRIF